MPGRGTHFVKTCSWATASCTALGSKLPAEFTHDVFGRTVDVGEVESREAGIEELEHGGDSGGWIDGAVRAETCHMPTGRRQMFKSGRERESA